MHSAHFKQKLDLLTFQSCPRLLHTSFPLMLSFDEIHPPTYPHPLTQSVSQSVTCLCLCHHRNHLYETEKCKKNFNFFCIFCPRQAEPAVAATATVAMIIACTHAGAGVCFFVCLFILLLSNICDMTHKMSFLLMRFPKEVHFKHKISNST